MVGRAAKSNEVMSANFGCWKGYDLSFLSKKSLEGRLNSFSGVSALKRHFLPDGSVVKKPTCGIFWQSDVPPIFDGVQIDYPL